MEQIQVTDSWETRNISLKYMFSDWVFFKKSLTLKVHPFRIISDNQSPGSIAVPEQPLQKTETGYLLRSLPLPAAQPHFRTEGEFIFYIPDQFERYYIDLTGNFEEYITKFSSKTRSTIRRKIKKFSSHCADGSNWQSYRSPEELREFYQKARQVSKNSYQETLLDSGLPDSEDFLESMIELARQDRARGYLMFDGEKPVAYMYCPISDNVLLYQYLGYDSDYARWSVGTILHWLAFEDIFSEDKFRYFDFTEGQSEHKRLYSTGSILCGNVYILKRNPLVWLTIWSHNTINQVSSAVGKFAESTGLKSKIKKFIRGQK